MFKKILVPLDGSELAAKILPKVEDLAKCEQAEVILLTVGTTSSMAHLAESNPSLVESTINALKTAATEYLASVADGMKTREVNANWIYREGLPAQEIILYANEVSCDLIALATHGRGEVAWVLGSVAEKIVSHSTIPVLLMRVMEAHPLVDKSEFFGDTPASWGTE